jgi:hypothetical protein
MTIQHPVLGSVSVRLNHKGYPRINSGPLRNEFLHRAVFEKIAGRPVREGFHVHHMNGKLCTCCWQLLEIQACLHRAAEPLRCPFTGRFMNYAEYERVYGRTYKPYNPPLDKTAEQAYTAGGR